MGGFFANEVTLHPERTGNTLDATTRAGPAILDKRHRGLEREIRRGPRDAAGGGRGESRSPAQPLKIARKARPKPTCRRVFSASAASPPPRSSAPPRLSVRTPSACDDGVWSSSAVQRRAVAHYIAYFFVHSLAVSSYLERSDL